METFTEKCLLKLFWSSFCKISNLLKRLSCKFKCLYNPSQHSLGLVKYISNSTNIFLVYSESQLFIYLTDLYSLHGSVHKGINQNVFIALLWIITLLFPFEENPLHDSWRNLASICQGGLWGHRETKPKPNIFWGYLLHLISIV